MPEGHHQNFLYLLKLLYLFGIDITEKNECKSKKSYINVMFNRTVCFLIFLNHFLSFLFIDIKLTGIHFMFVLARKLVEFSSIVLWVSLYKNRRNLCNLINTFNDAVKEFAIQPSKSLKIFSIIWLLLILTLGSSSFVESSFEAPYIEYLNYYTLGLYQDNQHINYYILYAVMIIYYFYVYVFHAIISIFYVSLCELGQKLLQKHLEKLKAGETNKIIFIQSKRDFIFDDYKRILRILHMIEDTMGFMVFILQVQNLCCMFNLLILFGAVEETFYLQTKRLIMTFVGTYASISFLVVSVYAWRVNETDKCIKRYGMEMQNGNLARVCMSNCNSCPGNAFVLTGWGFFDFDKRFVLSTIGNLLTYTLLIVQFNRQS